MSMLDLLLMITLGIAAQIAALVVFAFVRHRRSHRELHLQRDEDPASSAASPPAADLRRPSAPAWPGQREFRIRRKVVEDRSGNICSFYLEPVDGQALPPFAPGQYLTFHLSVEDPTTREPKQLVRCYSLSDAPDPHGYRITVKRIDASDAAPGLPEGLASGHLHRRVQIGDVLMVKAPAGHFHLTGDPAMPIVLVAGGIGITPMLSMLAASLVATPQRHVWLFYGVRNSSEHIMKELLQRTAQAHANFHLHICYSRPAADEVCGADYQHAGRVDVMLLRQTLPAQAHAFYVCGPRSMLETLVPNLIEWGVSEFDIHYEAFGPASLPSRRLPPAAIASRVTFSRTNKTLLWTGSEASLLELAEDNAIPVVSGCRAGGCGTCQTQLASGSVVYSHEPDFDVTPGHCLLCVGIPQGDVTLVA